MDRQVFNFWPGGGGVLQSGSRPAQGYYIVGSWGGWGQVDEMRKTEDGSFTYTVTLGVNGFETFQIWLDGEDDRILHPAEPQSASGSVVMGPSEAYAAEGLRWMIDGRTVPFEVRDAGAIADRGDQLVPSDASQSAVRVEMLPMSMRDQGRPGDQYEVKLHIAGKYRAVSWHKLGSRAIVNGGAMASLVAGRYYIAGSWSGWAFQEMEPSSVVPGLQTVEVTLSYGSTDFVIVRNKDWEQVFYPSSSDASSAAAGGETEVSGPDNGHSGLTWSLGGRSGQTFKVEFQRTLEDGKDLRTISWKAVAPQ